MAPAQPVDGEIPPELGGLSNLTGLGLSDNQLTGCIPEGLRDIEANDLGDLNLPDCGLEGRPAAGSFVSVSAGRGHTCGVRSDGSVACWGSDEDGQATRPRGPSSRQRWLCPHLRVRSGRLRRLLGLR